MLFGDVPEVPDVPAAPVTEDPDVPADPEDPEDPDVPDVPDDPDVPAVPLAPEIDSPDVPDVPLDPEIDSPDVPDDPDVPLLPDVPDVPLLPEVPEDPEGPSSPDVPEDPLVPVDPDSPVKKFTHLAVPSIPPDIFPDEGVIVIPEADIETATPFIASANPGKDSMVTVFIDDEAFIAGPVMFVMSEISAMAETILFAVKCAVPCQDIVIIEDPLYDNVRFPLPVDPIVKENLDETSS